MGKPVALELAALESVQSNVCQPPTRKPGQDPQCERTVLFARLSEDPLVLVEVRQEPEVDAQRIAEFTSGGDRDGECSSNSPTLRSRSHRWGSKAGPSWPSFQKVSATWIPLASTRGAGGPYRAWTGRGRHPRRTGGSHGGGFRSSLLCRAPLSPPKS
jgi:hypothetical protein